MKFTIVAKDPHSQARAGIIETPHGIIETPAFIPVATKATIKSLSPEMVARDVTAQAILANTYHLYLQPGTEVITKAGGLHKFMNWNGPTFTDSGGFQAFSLGDSFERGTGKILKEKGEGPSSASSQARLAKTDDDGVTFKSVIDGSTHRFTPEVSIQIQRAIGADIIFAFDECISPLDSYERQREAVARTDHWAERCIQEFAKPLPPDQHYAAGQALFGIVQGGRHRDLREQSALSIGAMPFDGFGIGGSFDKDDIGTAVGWVTAKLPEGKPRHLLGIGDPQDLVMAVKAGIDTFDCVAPTRIARNGAAYTTGTDGTATTVNLMNARFVKDMGPIEKTCDCYTCKNYTCAYVSHLFRAHEMFAATLVSIHNLHFIVNLVHKLRQDIIDGRLR